MKNEYDIDINTDSILLAIDASTKSTGIAIFKNHKLFYQTCIQATDEDVFNRIKFMCVKINSLIMEYNVTEVVIEDVIPEDVQGNNKVFKTLMYLQGFIYEICNHHNLKPTFYVASHWRKLCGIKTGKVKRDTLKAAAIQYVKENENIIVNDDVADAICLGYAYLQEHEEENLNWE